MSQRTELPRCQYPVPDRDRVDEDDCGEPAIAVWTFDSGGQMYVCSDHDAVLYEMPGEPEQPAPAYEADAEPAATL